MEDPSTKEAGRVWAAATARMSYSTAASDSAPHHLSSAHSPAPLSPQPLTIRSLAQNVRIPSDMPSPFTACSLIRKVASTYGPIRQFRAYMETELERGASKTTTRSALQSSGVTIADTPHNGGKEGEPFYSSWEERAELVRELTLRRTPTYSRRQAAPSRPLHLRPGPPTSDLRPHHRRQRFRLRLLDPPQQALSHGGHLPRD